LAAVLAALASTLALAAAAPAWHPDVGAASAFAHTRRGEVSFALRTPCGAWGRHQDRVAPSASVLKAMLLLAYLRRTSVRDRPLGRDQRALLTPMIRRSDNAAATRVLAIVGPGNLERAAHRWGLRRFRVRSPWGLSEITAREQARLWLHLDRRFPARHRQFALGLLRTIVAAQRWGVGRVPLGGWTVHFKGGWGSGTGRIDHQVALLLHGRQRVSLAILSTAQGSQRYGEATLRGVAVRLLRGLRATTRVCG
jgi:hypothetical protein